MHTIFHCISRTLLAAVLLCLLTSCTKTKLAYSFLDNWLRWETENYVDLNSEQKQLLKTQSKQFHQWHRANELIPLAELAGDSADLFNQPAISVQEIEQLLDQSEKLYQRSADQLRKLSDALLPTLSSEQTQQIMDKLDEQIQEYQEEYLAVSPSQRIEDRAENMADFLKGIVGKLTDDQQQLLNFWSQHQVGLAAEGLLQQRLWQQAFRTKLAEDTYSPTDLDDLAELIFAEMAPLNDQHQQVVLANRQRTYAMIADFHGTLTTKQKEKLNRQLTTYQQDFLALAAATGED
ncbi:DUF6279 family lipoprotein [Halioxenophilus aromaticivorans]|uniref:DUF6279 family lipoprotein n=1 Tax=Halioxenophilus aromaticivorans TaxID=1306992 RepID=A0AAV3U2Z3_9ALTE